MYLLGNYSFLHVHGLLTFDFLQGRYEYVYLLCNESFVHIHGLITFSFVQGLICRSAG